MYAGDDGLSTSATTTLLSLPAPQSCDDYLVAGCASESVLHGVGCSQRRRGVVARGWLAGWAPPPTRVTAAVAARTHAAAIISLARRVHDDQLLFDARPERCAWGRFVGAALLPCCFHGHGLATHTQARLPSPARLLAQSHPPSVFTSFAYRS